MMLPPNDPFSFNGSFLCVPLPWTDLSIPSFRTHEPNMHLQCIYCTLHRAHSHLMSNDIHDGDNSFQTFRAILHACVSCVYIYCKWFIHKWLDVAGASHHLCSILRLCVFSLRSIQHFFFPLTNELQASYSSSGKNDEEYFEGNKNVCHRNQQQTIQIFVQTFNVIYNHQCLFIRCGFMNSKFMRFFFLTCGLWPRIYASAMCLIDVWEYWEFSGSGMALFIGITFYCTATVWCYCCCFFFSSNV